MPDDDDDDINKGQNDLVHRIEKAICSSTDEWELSVVDVVGVLECVKSNYLRISAQNMEDEERAELEDNEGEDWKNK